MRHLSCDPNAETLGINILAFFQNLRDYETAPVMEKYGLGSIGPDDWASAGHFLDAMNDLADSTEIMATLVSIGMAVGATLEIPGKRPRLGDALTAWNDIYQGQHRGADVGQIACQKMGDEHYVVTLTDLYPDDLSYGIMYGYARRFLPPNTLYTIAYDLDTKPRDRGGDSGQTVIHAKWE